MKTIKKNAFVAAVTGVLFLCLTYSCNPDKPEENAAPVKPDLKIKGVSVFVFMTPDCPLCQSYTATLNQLCDSFAGHGITFTGIIPGTAYRVSEIDSFKSAYELGFKLITDSDFRLTAKYGATVTPEVFVADSSGRIIYAGRIDNWMYETGKKRTAPDEHNLRDVLTAITKGEKRTFVSKQAFGCIIEQE